MKYSIVLSTVLLLIEFVIAQSDSASCEGERTGTLLPNPGNCSTYIICVYGEDVIMPCPEDLHWNNAVKQCDYPENANCEEEYETLNEKSKTVTSCKGVPSNVDVLLPNPANCSTYIQCVHENPVVRPCPEGLHWSVSAERCEWPDIAKCNANPCEGVSETEDVLLPNPEDCGSYIQCVHQKPVIRSCPSGLHWSVEANRCEWPNIAHCNNIVNP